MMAIIQFIKDLRLCKNVTVFIDLVKLEEHYNTMLIFFFLVLGGMIFRMQSVECNLNSSWECGGMKFKTR